MNITLFILSRLILVIPCAITLVQEKVFPALADRLNDSDVAKLHIFIKLTNFLHVFLLFLVNVIVIHINIYTLLPSS